MYVHFSATQRTMYVYFKVYTLLYLLREISTVVLFAEGSLICQWLTQVHSKL